MTTTTLGTPTEKCHPVPGRDVVWIQSRNMRLEERAAACDLPDYSASVTLRPHPARSAKPDGCS